MVVRSSFSQHPRSFVRQFVNGHDRCNVPTRSAKCGQKNTAFKKIEDLRQAGASTSIPVGVSSGGRPLRRLKLRLGQLGGPGRQCVRYARFESA